MRTQRSQPQTPSPISTAWQNRHSCPSQSCKLWHQPERHLSSNSCYCATEYVHLPSLSEHHRMDCLTISPPLLPPTLKTTDAACQSSSVAFSVTCCSKALTARPIATPCYLDGHWKSCPENLQVGDAVAVGTFRLSAITLKKKLRSNAWP